MTTQTTNGNADGINFSDGDFGALSGSWMSARAANFMAVAAGGSFTFDGRYSNADVAAIADAFTVKTGKRPSSAWLADLRYTESARNDGACYEGKILDRQDAAFGDYL